MKKISKYKELKPKIVSQTNRNVDTFKKIYESSPLEARIYVSTESVGTEEMLLFEPEDGIFQVVSQSITYGVSKTNIMFIRRKRYRSFLVNKDKFYVSTKKPDKLVCASTVNLLDAEKKILIEKHPWMAFLFEYHIGLSFNTIFRYKLFTLKKALAHQYKIPYPTCRAIHEKIYKSGHAYHWKHILERLMHRNNFNDALLNDMTLLIDSARMAKQLNVQINPMWGEKRLKLEHDKWSKIVSDVIYKIKENTPLKNAKPFVDFATFLGKGNLLKNSKELYLEGQTQNHCVATYEHKINNLQSAIYHIHGYTLELSFDTTGKLYINQFRGFRNVQAPKELFDEVNLKLKEFNLTYKHENYKHSHSNSAGWQIAEQNLALENWVF